MTDPKPPVGQQAEEVRIFPEQEERVESGPIRFGDDWPGMFLRGDNALSMAWQLKMFLARPDVEFYKSGALNVIKRLEQCDMRKLSAVSQVHPKPVASPVTLSGETKLSFTATEEDIRTVKNSSDQTVYTMALMFLDACRQLKALKPVAVPLSEGQPKSFKSEQCVCGHGSSQHEWEDEFTSCCMAHLRLFNGVGEGKPCMCIGYKPLSEGHIQGGSHEIYKG